MRRRDQEIKGTFNVLLAFEDCWLQARIVSGELRSRPATKHHVTELGISLEKRIALELVVESIWR
jgi:hypothetical protein